MAHRTIFAGLALALTILAACQPAPSAGDQTPRAEAAAQPAPTIAAATIISVTDAGYPMFAVVASVAGQPAPLELLLNAEEAELKGASPDTFAGKVVTLGYTNLPERSLTDVRLEGKSLLGGEAPQIDPSWSSVSGVLGGAGEVTASDLPGMIEVAPANGEKVSFEYFVGPELVAANGKEVTAYFTTDNTARIVSIAAKTP